MLFDQHDNVIQAIPLDTTYHSFRKRILPRAARRSERLFDTQASDAPLKRAPINGISIPQDVLGCRISRKRFNDLLPSPLSGGMLRDIEVHDRAAAVGENH